MTTLAVITIGEGLTILTQLVGFGCAAYKFGQWNQSIEDRFAGHDKQFASHERRLAKHRTTLLGLMRRTPAGGPAT